MISLARLTWVFLRVGNLTLGGGNPTMAVLERELVQRRGWLAAEQYGLAYGLARLTPGTNVLAFCAGVAWLLRGWWGAVSAVLASTVPSAALAVWITYAYENVKASAAARGAIAGLLAAAVGMMLAAAWHLVRPHLGRRRLARTLALFGGAALLATAVGLAPIQVLALAAALGWVWRGEGP